MTNKEFIIDGIIKKVNNNGYVSIKCGMNWVLEHHLVVENKIGRKLKEGETVHHIDFNKKNNDISNLFLFHSQREHKSFENKFKQFGMTQPIQKMIEERWENFT
jgi:Holliday junction resolvasome RuvABC DNA-binding subunit